MTDAAGPLSTPLPAPKVTKALWTAVLSCIAGGVLLVGLFVVARLRNSSSTDLLSSTSYVASSPSKSDSSFTNKWCRVQPDQQVISGHERGEPAALLLSPTLQEVDEKGPLATSSIHSGGNLFTFFLTAPSLAFCRLVGVPAPNLQLGIYEQLEKHTLALSFQSQVITHKVVESDQVGVTCYKQLQSCGALL